MMGLFVPLTFFLVVLVIIVLANAIRIVREYERLVVFRLGRLQGERGPGLVLLWPVIDRAIKVDLRTVTLDVPSQDIITRDNVSVKVNAVVFYRVMSAKDAVVQVENYLFATSQIAQTTLRSILGQQELDELLSEREKLNQALQQVIDRQTEPWGVKVSTVEVKNVDLPQDMQRAIARQAEAERERRAKVINAEGEYQAAARLAEAAARDREGAGGDSAALPSDAGGDRDREQLHHHLPGPDRLPAGVHERGREEALILVTGGRGLLGTALLAELRSNGREAVALTRGAPRSGLERQWDPTAPSSETFEGAEAVVHLAGATIAERWTASRRRAIRASRVDSTRGLVGALGRLAARPSVLISASAVGIYGDRGDERLTEESAPGRGFLAEVSKDWEAEAARGESFGIRVVMLRFGVVLVRGGGMLGRLLPLFRLGLGGAPGHGRQWWSWVAIEDAMGAVRRALEDDAIRGPVNVVSPEPVTAREFARSLGRVLSRPAVAPAPAMLLGLAFGEMAREVLLASQRVEPARLRSAGFQFQRPTLDGALRAACTS